MSLIDVIGLPFVKKYLKKSLVENKNFYVFLSAMVCISKAMLLMLVIKQYCTSILCEIITQPQKKLLLVYLMMRVSTSNLVLNEESSLTPTIMVFDLLPVLLPMSMHFFFHGDLMMQLTLHATH